MRTATDLSGLKFGKLQVISLSRKGENGYYWNCICECGNKKEIFGKSLMAGQKGCGCLRGNHQKHHSTHGMSGKGKRTPEYDAWNNMLRRCEYEKHPQYKSYGSRGIAVCKRWHKFENFYADMGKRPEGLTLERIKNNKGYSPSNCKWATWERQRENRRYKNCIAKRSAEYMIKNGHDSIVWGNDKLIRGMVKYLGIKSNARTTGHLLDSLNHNKIAQKLFDKKLVHVPGSKKPVRLFTLKVKTLQDIKNADIRS